MQINFLDTAQKIYHVQNVYKLAVPCKSKRVSWTVPFLHKCEAYWKLIVFGLLKEQMLKTDCDLKIFDFQMIILSMNNSGRCKIWYSWFHLFLSFYSCNLFGKENFWTETLKRCQVWFSQFDFCFMAGSRLTLGTSLPLRTSCPDVIKCFMMLPCHRCFSAMSIDWNNPTLEAENSFFTVGYDTDYM